MPSPPGLRLIIAYKGARAVTSLLAAAVIAALTVTGNSAALGSFAEGLRHHATSAWSVALTEALMSIVTPRHLWIGAGALVVDGAFTALEGWALHYGAAWGPWLVTIATCTFIPFEVAALAHHPHAGRAFVLAFNVAIVLYLGRCALLEVGSLTRRS
jgi:uncharacterized membrane protein (DUF2068 family)